VITFVVVLGAGGFVVVLAGSVNGTFGVVII
jgi:hypothetical protein